MAMHRYFEDFESSGPIGTISTALPRPRPFAEGVLQIDLSGKIGSDQVVSLLRVKEKLATVNHSRHLHIVLNGLGGESSEGFRIYDYLRALALPISVQVTGQCLSASVDILMAGSFRFAGPQALFLLHQTSRTRESLSERVTASSLAQASTDLAQVDAKVADLLAARTAYNREYFAQEILSEDPITAADAYACGLLHEVSGLTPTVDPRWPEIVRTQRFGQILIDRKLFQSSFLEACRTSATLFDWSAPA